MNSSCSEWRESSLFEDLQLRYLQSKVDALSQAQTDKDSVIINPGRRAIEGLRSIKSTEGQRAFKLPLVTVKEIRRKIICQPTLKDRTALGNLPEFSFPSACKSAGGSRQPCPGARSPRDARDAPSRRSRHQVELRDRGWAGPPRRALAARGTRSGAQHRRVRTRATGEPGSRAQGVGQEDSTAKTSQR